MYKIAVCMSSQRDVYASTHKGGHTNTYLLKSPVADEKSWIIICAKPTVNSVGKKNKPLSKAVHTFSTAVFQQRKGQAALSLLTTLLEQELFYGSTYPIICTGCQPLAVVLRLHVP